MKFSQCGRLLATGGQDNLLHIWTLKTAFAHFDEMRRKYSKGEWNVAGVIDNVLNHCVITTESMSRRLEVVYFSMLHFDVICCFMSM